MQGQYAGDVSRASRTDETPLGDRPNPTGLRRVPQQRRSRERVNSALNALLDLVQSTPLACEITTTDVAERAGLPIGSLYVYFEDLESLVDAAVVRMLDRHDEIVGAVMDDPPTELDPMVDRLLDAYVTLHRTEPGFRALRDSTLFQPYHLQWYDQRVAIIIERVAATLWPDSDSRERRHQLDRLSLVFALGDAALVKAFRDDPAGDPLVLEQTREILGFALGRVWA